MQLQLIALLASCSIAPTDSGADSAPGSGERREAGREGTDDSAVDSGTGESDTGERVVTRTELGACGTDGPLCVQDYSAMGMCMAYIGDDFLAYVEYGTCETDQECPTTADLVACCTVYGATAKEMAVYYYAPVYDAHTAVEACDYANGELTALE